MKNLADLVQFEPRASRLRVKNFSTEPCKMPDINELCSVKRRSYASAKTAGCNGSKLFTIYNCSAFQRIILPSDLIACETKCILWIHIGSVMS